MKAIVNIARELFGLFVDDGALALAILGVVVLCVALTAMAAAGLLIGAALLIGCIAVLIESVLRATRAGTP